jgi:hypothetical protein
VHCIATECVRVVMNYCSRASSFRVCRTIHGCWSSRRRWTAARRAYCASAPLLCSVSETGMGDFSAGPFNLFCGCFLFVGAGLCTIHIVAIAKSVVPKNKSQSTTVLPPGADIDDYRPLPLRPRPPFRLILLIQAPPPLDINRLLPLPPLAPPLLLP